MKDETRQDLSGGASPVACLIGQSLKHFRVESVLGEGGMGVVYRAHDSKLHRPVAVKLLSSEVTSDPERKQRFLQEARAAARISHPAIAQIFYVDEEDDRTFIVMEMVEGKTVRQLILDRELDLLGAMDIGIQVAEGLAKAHELGIVHRDIKPANVMLTRDGHVKILDFGLAKLLDLITESGSGATRRVEPWPAARTESGVVMGTPAYMSPEQVKGAAVDGRADIFSLGVMLFEMATWQSPFERGNFMETMHAVAYDESPPMQSMRAQIPHELQRIVSRCLRKRVEDRYANARLLAEDLRRLRRDAESGVAHRTSWRQRLLDMWENVRAQPPSRYVWMGLGLAGLVLALNYSLDRMGAGGAAFLLIVVFWIYRHVRSRRQRLQSAFVRQVAKLPEVRMIVIRDQDITVAVDRPAAQLYNRINARLRVCNRKLYYGQPMTVSIQHGLSAEQTQRLLTGPGVEYVREDAP